MLLSKCSYYFWKGCLILLIGLVSYTLAVTLKSITPIEVAAQPYPQAHLIYLPLVHSVQQQPSNTKQFEIREKSASPDGNWEAKFIYTPCERTSGAIDRSSEEQFRLVNLRDRTERLIESQLLNCDGIGASGLGGLFWSSDSRYFYYTTAREGRPDGDGDWTPDVKQVDVTTGEVRQIR